jgi:hypothetical protein
MSSDFGLDSWLETKSRREFRKYSTGHSYKQKKVEIKKNEYIEITRQNPILNKIDISQNKNSIKKIHVPENCILRKDKRDNNFIVNLLTNVKINTEKKGKEGEKELYNFIKYRDNENEESYTIRYDIVQAEKKIEPISSNIINNENKINKNRVRRERIKKPKIVEISETKQVKLDNKIMSYKIIKQDHKDIQYKKKEPEKEIFSRKKTSFKTQKDDYYDFILAVDDTVLEKDFDHRINELRVVDQVLSNIELNENNSFEFIPLISKKSSTDYLSLKQKFLKNLNNSLSKKTINNEECEICFTPEVHELISLNDCNHKACLTCWQKYAETIIKSLKVQANNNFKLNCFSCNSELGINFISSILPVSIVNQYKEFYCQLRIEKSDEYAKCLNEKCNRVIVINRESTYNISICECNSMICNKCRQSAHYPISCEDEFKFRTDINLDNHKKVFDILAKICPTCKRPIEKNGGCNHMR